MDFEAPKKAPEPISPPQKVSMEAKIEEIFSRPLVPERQPPPKPVVIPPVLEEPKPQPVQEEVKKVFGPEAKPIAPAVEEVAAVEYFECPQCGTMLESTASSCPKCGVIFAEEGAEMFQCPACNTLVNVDAKSCPGCGAVFVEAEEAAASAEVAPAPPKAKMEMERPSVAAPPEKPKVGRIVEAEPEAEEVKEKKGLGRWFRRGKKEEEEPEPKEEKVEVARPMPTRPPEMKVRELRVEEQVPRAVAPPAPPTVPVPKDKGRDLARMVAEMKPLLALARDKEIDIGDSKQLIDDAALAGRDRQLDKAIELVEKSKTLLMQKIDANLAQEISRLSEEIKVARDFGGDISRATTYIQELARARSGGDVEAAYVYVDKVKKELLPITGRYNESKKKISSLKLLIADCEIFIVDTKEARSLLVDTNRAFGAKDFDKVDSLVKNANEKLYKAIPARMNEEMRKAKDDLLEAKMRNVNITPLITTLKSATSLMKSGDYAQALKEMRDFKDQMKKNV